MISCNASTREILGLTRPQLYDADFGAAFSANPVELWYYALYFAPTSGQLANLIVQVRLEYDCEFYDRAPVSLSFSQIVDARKKISSLKESQSSWSRDTPSTDTPLPRFTQRKL